VTGGNRFELTTVLIRFPARWTLHWRPNLTGTWSFQAHKLRQNRDDALTYKTVKRGLADTATRALTNTSFEIVRGAWERQGQSLEKCVAENRDGTAEPSGRRPVQQP
jgi:hypothetical protein